MKKLLGLFLCSVLTASAFTPLSQANASAAVAFKWNATTLAPNSLTTRKSLIDCSVINIVWEVGELDTHYILEVRSS